MKVDKVNKKTLNEIRRKKYLNELVDFCLYGDCLQEETAREYFLWLLPRVIEKISNDLLNAKSLETNVYRKEFSNYEKWSEKDRNRFLSELGDARFSEFEKGSTKEKDSGIVKAYFDETFNMFAKNMEKIFTALENRAKALHKPSKDIEKLKMCFHYYCSLFVKDNFYPYPYLSVKAMWEDKNGGKLEGSVGVKRMLSDESNRKEPTHLNKGESWNAEVDVTIEDVKNRLDGYV